MLNKHPAYASRSRQEPSIFSLRSGMTREELSKHAHRWLKICLYNQQTPKTLEQRTFVIEMLIWWLDREQVDNVTLDDFHGFLHHSAQGHKEPDGRWGKPDQRKPVSRRTTHNYFRILRTFINWMVEEQIISTPFFGEPRSAGSASAPRLCWPYCSTQPFAPTSSALW
jgi:hypothetical protein